MRGLLSVVVPSEFVWRNVQPISCNDVPFSSLRIDGASPVFRWKWHPWINRHRLLLHDKCHYRAAAGFIPYDTNSVEFGIKDNHCTLACGGPVVILLWKVCLEGIIADHSRHVHSTC